MEWASDCVVSVGGCERLNVGSDCSGSVVAEVVQRVCVTAAAAGGEQVGERAV